MPCEHWKRQNLRRRKIYELDEKRLEALVAKYRAEAEAGG